MSKSRCKIFYQVKVDHFGFADAFEVWSDHLGSGSGSKTVCGKINRRIKLFTQTFTKCIIESNSTLRLYNRCPFWETIQAQRSSSSIIVIVVVGDLLELCTIQRDSIERKWRINFEPIFPWSTISVAILNVNESHSRGSIQLVNPTKNASFYILLCSQCGQKWDDLMMVGFCKSDGWMINEFGLPINRQP